jgi:hypothetical protein
VNLRVEVVQLFKKWGFASLGCPLFLFQTGIFARMRLSVSASMAAVACATLVAGSAAASALHADPGAYSLDKKKLPTDTHVRLSSLGWRPRLLAGHEQTALSPVPPWHSLYHYAWTMAVPPAGRIVRPTIQLPVPRRDGPCSAQPDKAYTPHTWPRELRVVRSPLSSMHACRPPTFLPPPFFPLALQSAPTSPGASTSPTA